MMTDPHPHTTDMFKSVSLRESNTTLSNIVPHDVLHPSPPTPPKPTSLDLLDPYEYAHFVLDSTRHLLKLNLNLSDSVIEKVIADLEHNPTLLDNVHEELVALQRDNVPYEQRIEILFQLINEAVPLSRVPIRQHSLTDVVNGPLSTTSYMPLSEPSYHRANTSLGVFPSLKSRSINNIPDRKSLSKSKRRRHLFSKLQWKSCVIM